MNTVLYISYDGMTDPLGQSQVLPYLVGLAAHGYKIHLLSFEKKARYEKESEIIRDITEKAGIKWIPLFFTKNPPILSKIYDRWQLRKKVQSLFRRQKFDLVHCRSYVAAEMGLWAKKKFGTAFLFDMRGFWPDEKVDAGQWKLNNPVYRKVYNHYKEKEKDFLSRADAVVSLTQAAREELNARKDFQQLVIDVIPCCADLAHFDYHRVDENRRKQLQANTGIRNGDKIISYLGSVGGWYMTHEMFGFFKRLIKKHPDYKMLVLTKDEPGKVQAEAAAEGIPPDRLFVKYAQRNELPDHIALSDCSIFFIRPTYSKIASSPTKHAELMGMGIPVICNGIGDTAKIIENTGTGMVVSDFTTTSFDKLIEKIPQLEKINREHIRKAAFDYFDLEKGIAAYLKIYKRILDN